MSILAGLLDRHIARHQEVKMAAERAARRARSASVSQMMPPGEADPRGERYETMPSTGARVVSGLPGRSRRAEAGSRVFGVSSGASSRPAPDVSAPDDLNFSRARNELQRLAAANVAKAQAEARLKGIGRGPKRPSTPAEDAAFRANSRSHAKNIAIRVWNDGEITIEPGGQFLDLRRKTQLAPPLYSVRADQYVFPVVSGNHTCAFVETVAKAAEVRRFMGADAATKKLSRYIRMNRVELEWLAGGYS
jgi:hypothetical protein